MFENLWNGGVPFEQLIYGTEGVRLESQGITMKPELIAQGDVETALNRLREMQLDEALTKKFMNKSVGDGKIEQMPVVG